MGGYIGAKTGTLVASASDIRGDISATDTTPEIVLKNTTETDADGGREGTLTFKGEKSGGEEVTLAQIEGSHDSTNDDSRGQLVFKTNNNQLGDNVTETKMTINSSGNVDVTANTASITIRNTSEEDTDGGRESKFKFQGEQSGGEISTLAEIQGSHDGTADDEKGDLIFKTNDGSDGVSPTERLRIDSAGKVGIGDSAPDNHVNIKESELSGRGASNGNTSLTLEHATDTGIQFFSATQTQLRFGDAASTGAGSIIYTHSDNNMKFATDGSERMRMDSAGSVGIGVTPYSHSGLGTFSTVNNLSLIGNGTSGAYVGYNIYYNSDWKYAESSAACLLSLQNDGALTFRQGASGTKDNAVSLSERFRVDTSGNLLVGRTSNPSGVSNCIYALGNYGITTGSGANVHINSEGLFFRSTSSERYKNTIQDATHGLTELLTLRPVTFKNNEDGDRIYGGLIAEEVHEAGLTEFVQYNDDNEPDALDYGNIVSLCIKAIQEQQATITAQATKIDALETQNTTQATQIADLITRVTALEAE